jgi:hypothetical protein
LPSGLGKEPTGQQEQYDDDDDGGDPFDFETFLWKCLRGRVMELEMRKRRMNQENRGKNQKTSRKIWSRGVVNVMKAPFLGWVNNVKMNE